MHLPMSTNKLPPLLVGRQTHRLYNQLAVGRHVAQAQFTTSCLSVSVPSLVHITVGKLDANNTDT